MAKKRVHEIAKSQGMTSKEVLTKLQAAGLEVKAAASSVDEADALKALGGGNGATPGEAAAQPRGEAQHRRRRRQAGPGGPCRHGAAPRRAREAGCRSGSRRPERARAP